MPLETVPSRPCGFPSATTSSPILTESESPNLTEGVPVSGVVRTARSYLRSKRVTSDAATFLPRQRTTTVAAFSMTCAFDATDPFASTKNPLPNANGCWSLSRAMTVTTVLRFSCAIRIIGDSASPTDPTVSTSEPAMANNAMIFLTERTARSTSGTNNSGAIHAMPDRNAKRNGRELAAVPKLYGSELPSNDSVWNVIWSRDSM